MRYSLQAPVGRGVSGAYEQFEFTASLRFTLIHSAFEEAPMLPVKPINPVELDPPADGQQAPGHRVEMTDVKYLVETGRQILHANPHLTEAEFRNLMLEHFRASDKKLQEDKANMIVSPGDSWDGVLALFELPWTVFRWLGWRDRLAGHHAEIDEVVRVLRGQGHFAPAPA
jgi:hypothetical protein